LHPRHFARAAVFKTNQVVGGLQALRAARIFRRPLVARCGYLRSEGMATEHGPGSPQARRAKRYERRLFRGADVVAVTTEHMRTQVLTLYGVPSTRVMVVPNYVDVDLFSPSDGEGAPRSLAFVGRLTRQKNLFVLLDALAGLDDVSLTLIGDGPQRSALERYAERRGVDAKFEGRLPHDRLPALLSRAQAFVMPSVWEGHPKALLEAMACGLPVIGSNVHGIREVVRDGESGILCEPSSEGLRRAIESVLGDAELRQRLGSGARDAAARLSLERVVERELEVLRAARMRRVRR
jgi:glycosyltransferase involved in cell wall biosynthesis